MINVHCVLLIISWTLRFVVAHFVIFLTTLYDIIFQWWSRTHNSDQNLSCEHDFIFLILEFATLDLNVMERSCPCPLCWGCHQACLNMFAWHLTQHNGHGFDNYKLNLVFYEIWNLFSSRWLVGKKGDWLIIDAQILKLKDCSRNRLGVVSLKKTSVKIRLGVSSIVNDTT